MTPDSVFSIVNLLALGAWMVLAVAPRRRWANLVIPTAVPALLSILYVTIIGAYFPGSEGGFSTLSDVATLFENRWLLLAGWTHYLAFDLLVGSWEVRDASERGIPHLFVLPCLVLTFLFGPAGWLSYLAVRSVAPRRAATTRPSHP
jgi:hypothetical protein